MSTTEHKQAPRTAWINAMRAEVLRVGKRLPEVARVACIGVWIATYADADGSNTYPGRDTLAVLAGCSQETVTRAVKVLVGVGALERKRRPNQSAMYRLRLFLPGDLAWEEHLHHYTDTRQRRAHAKKKAQAVAKVTAPKAAPVPKSDSVCGRVPDSVHDGGSGDTPDSVHGRPRTASTDAFRTASMAGVYKDTPTSGRDPRADHESVARRAQPQVDAGARAESDQSSEQQEGGPRAFRQCPCGLPLIRMDRELCHGCERAEESTREPAPAPVQGAFLLPLPTSPTPAVNGPRTAVPAPRPDDTAPLRLCACGREHRAHQPTDPCPDCLTAQAVDLQTRRAVSGA